jgi:membrane fusion protein (multidrug efflux system)
MNLRFAIPKRALSKLAFTTFLATSSLPLTALAQGLPAEVVHAKEQILPTYIEAVGTIKANESLIIRPENTGRVDVISFTEGSFVKKGSPLVHFDDAIYKAQVAEAEARVLLSKTEFQRVDKLFNKGATSGTTRDSAFAQLQINRAQLDQAKVSLARMTLKAPFSGIVGLRQFSPGDYIIAGSDMLKIVDISKMKLDFQIPEIYLPQVKSGQKLDIKLASFPDQNLTGEVVAISPQISEQGRNILVRASLPNHNNMLRPGLFAKVQLLIKEESSITVPEQAIIPQGGQFMVYLYKDEKVTPAPIKIIKRFQGQVALTGINAGDVVITAGQLKLQPGSPITPIFVDGSTPKANSPEEKQSAEKQAEQE